MPVVTSKAYMYVVPVHAEVTVVDEGFHKMGDVNRDGVIDDYDLDLFKEAYEEYWKTGVVDPDCDFNGDGKIDGVDIRIIARNFGKTAPSYYTPFTTEVATGICVLNGRHRRQKLKATAYVADGKRVLFFFSALGVLGRPVVI